MNYITALPQQTELRPITVEWEKTFGGNAHDFGATVYPTQDGGYIVGGDTKSFGAGSRDILLIKTNSSGNKMWETTLGGIGFDAAVCIDTISNDEFIVCGETKNYGNGGKDIYLVKCMEIR